MFIFKYLKFKYIHIKHTVLPDNKITEIFYFVDECCLELEKSIQKHLVGNKPNRKPKKSGSEVITIMIMFHSGGFSNMKHFYMHYVQKHMNHLFGETVSYNGFLEWIQGATLPRSLVLKTCCMGDGTGIAFIDSTPIRVGKNKRIKRNKVFEGLGKVGKSTMGYFFGVKLHIVINDKGELLNFVISLGNIEDREPLKNPSFIKALKGKLYADKGYISQ